MIPLAAHKIDFSNYSLGRKTYKLDDEQRAPLPLRKNLGFLCKSNDIPDGYAFYISFDDQMSARLKQQGKEYFQLTRLHRYISDSDVIKPMPDSSSMRVMYRKNSHSNSFLLTERCNHYCLMCSQPPRNVDDSYIFDEVMETIPLIDVNTQEIGFTGGEPTLLGDRFIKILEACKNYLPRTTIHILSNGRKFQDKEYTAKYAAINHHDMMVGIPLYSDVSHIHDYVVQADGAFDETIRGILNLKRAKQKVEIRVVIHKQTFERLPQLATFIARNLAFVDHVALMGLEITGFTKANMNDLWIDANDYRSQLEEATNILALHRLNVSIYNHQLCTVPTGIWKFARKSISDWKNEYVEECQKCSKKDECGGFFTSQLIKPSAHIKAITNA